MGDGKHKGRRASLLRKYKGRIPVGLARAQERVRSGPRFTAGLAASRFCPRFHSPHPLASFRALRRARGVLGLLCTRRRRDGVSPSRSRSATAYLQASPTR